MRETFAIIIVAALVGLFLLLLVGAFIRSRQAATVFREAAAGKVARPEPETPKPAKRPSPVSRRDFFRRSLLASIGLFSAEFGLASIAFVWPNLRGGFGSVVDVGLAPDAIKQQIEQDNQPFYYGAGRFYLVSYEGEGVDTLYEGLVSEGLMALYQKCVHLGCRVPWCVQSQWFECPCHGSKYNRVGEKKGGPAPRGMDRFPVDVSGEQVVINTATQVQGPAIGTNTTGQEAEGPNCV
jgi:cytochrome b6-f complex iron-sulfur subunit